MAWSGSCAGSATTGTRSTLRPASLQASPQQSARWSAPGMGRRLLEHSAIYAGGTLATSLAIFLLLPLYVRALTPSEYGTLEVTLTTVILSIRALSLEVHAGLFQRYFLAESDADR